MTEIDPRTSVLLETVDLGSHRAPNRILFGPLVTNLGDEDRRLTNRHVAFYERRARGGCGVIVVEGASVHDSDWPYERAPLASRCGDGWQEIATACHRHGALVIASLDHAGGQGSSAYGQRELWAPSPVPEVNSREVPKIMEASDIAAVIDGFASAARLAVEAGCDGVEINAGQHSLVRQFLSGLTNQRSDAWGSDRTRFATEVITAVRSAVGPRIAVTLRFSGDELAPWAGITPEMAPGLAARLAASGLDAMVVTRGSIFSASMTRPDFHEPPGFNRDLTSAIRTELADPTRVVLSGSVIDVAMAADSVRDGICDLVEMTRAQLADPDLVTKIASGHGERIRPCLLCNQTCQVRDPRNPIVSCVVEPSTGHETTDPDWEAPASRRRRLTVIGAGPAGLEAARVARARGHDVTVLEARETPGGLARHSGPGAAFVDWALHELDRHEVEIRTGVTVTEIPPAAPDEIPPAAPDEIVVQCTGSRPGERTYDVDPTVESCVVDVAAYVRGEVEVAAAGTVVVHDPIGGPIAVAIAEALGERAVLVTPDHIAGNELSRTGDLAPANVRLRRAGVTLRRRSLLRGVRPDSQGIAVEVQDRFTGRRESLEATVLIDCGFRLPTAPLEGARVTAGDAVAPRTLYEAVLEGRRAVLEAESL